MATKDHQSEPIESASETLQRIFDGHGSVLGSQMADESSRYVCTQENRFPKASTDSSYRRGQPEGGSG